MKLTIGQLEDIWREEYLELDDGTELTLVETGDWDDQGKFQTKQVVFTDGGNFYAGYVERSGSHFTHYDFGSDIYGSGSLADIDEVTKVEVVTYEWR